MSNSATLSLIIQAKDYASKVLKTVTGAMNKLESATQKADRSFQEFKTSMNEMARYAKYALGAITATGTAIVAFSKDTEKAMANASTMFGVAGKEFEKQLGNRVARISQQYGISLKKMWDATYALGSAGIALENVPAVLEQTARAAVAGGADIETAFTGAIKQIKGFGLSLNDLEKVYAVQFQAVKYGLLTYDQLAQYIPEIAASARSLGEDWKSATATFATLTKYMPDAAQAANALQNAYDELTQKSENLAKAGIKLYDNGKFIGFVKVLEQIRNQLKGKTNEEVAEFINSLELSDTARGAIVNLVNNFEDLETITNSVTDDVSALNEMFLKQTQTLEFQLRRLFVVFDNLKQSIYNTFKSTLGQWVQKAIIWIQGLTKWIDENKEKFIALISAITRLLTTIIIFNIILNLIGKIGDAVRALANPFTWLFGVLLAWFASLDKAKRAEVIENILKGLGNAIEWIGKQFEIIRKEGLIKWLLDLFKNFAKLAFNITINLVKGSAEKLWDWFNKGAKIITIYAVGGGYNLWSWFIDSIRKITIDVFQGLNKLWDWFKEGLITILIYATKGGTDLWPWFNNGLKSIVINVLAGSLLIWEWLKKGSRRVKVDLLKGADSLYNWLKTGIIEVTVNLIQGTIALWDWFKKGVKQISIDLITAGNVAISTAKDVTLKFIEDISNISKWIIEGIKKITLSLIFSYVKTYQWIFDGAKTLALTISFSIAEGAKKIWNFFEDLIKNAWTKTIQFTIDLFKGKNEFEEKPVNPDAEKTMKDNKYIIPGETSANLTGAANSTTTLATDVPLTTGQYALRMAGIFGSIGTGVLTSSALSATFLEEALKYALFAAGFASGGYTGDGGKYDVAGVVHKGEYVIPAWMVKKYPQLVAMLEQKRIRGYETGGGVDIVSLISNYLSGSGNTNIAKDFTETKNIANEILNYVMNYVPDAKENENVIRTVLNQLLGIEDDSNKAQKETKNILLEQLKLAQTLYPQTKAYYDLETKQLGSLSQMFKGGFDVLTGSIRNVGTLVADGIMKTSWAQNISNWIKSNAKSAGNAISGGLSSFGNAMGELGSQISLDPIYGPILDGLKNVFGGITGLLGDIFGPVIQAIMSLSNVVSILNPITTIVESLMAVIGPLINSALQPFVNILKALGQMLGTLLIPLFSPLFAGLQAIGAVLTWIYNSVLVPIGRGFYVVFGMIASAFNWLYNVVSDIVKGLTFGVLDIGKRAVKSFGQIVREANEKVSEIDMNVEQNVENSYQSQYTSTVQRSGPEVVNNTFIINANDSFIMDGESSFKEYLAKTVQELFDNGTLKFA
ncbi:hypothetical protein XO10_00670 [Marinitoga sp. 1135]|uniref:phage tail tape measure protein n=1 Tax=Marinitoga sp. 1135 TaxID=1643333 RepID=UPI0015866D56|nr:phage tail tape measure protein [Marinitoga sp. 1135]NUU94831.1 hypothetical protein [Marinitoga sp. 1135]